MMLPNNINNNRLERIWLLAKIEFKLRYYENNLGLLWALIKPISEMLIFYVAFEFLLGNKIPNYISYLYLGIIIWNFFIESSSGMIAILGTKKYLYEYSNISKIEIYVAQILSISIGFLFNMTIFVLYFLASGNTFSINVLYLPLILLNLFFTGLGISMVLSTIYLLAKDINQIWGLITAMGFWLSPILFRAEQLREKLPLIDYFNPISGIMINAREIMMYNNSPDFNLLAINFFHSSLLLILGVILVKKLGAKASELL
jgi:ABC-type polysaccharide/polyol phosphate export permease